MASKAAAQAKPPTRSQTQPRQEVARSPKPGGAIGSTELSDEALAKMTEQSGIGLSEDMSDYLIPYIYVLQPLSPQVLARNEQQIPGAEPGDIWLKGSEDPIHKEMWFQPCIFWREWVLWVPRAKGGGIAGRAPGIDENRPPEGATRYVDPENPNAPKWKSPDGNDWVFTRYFGGNVWAGEDTEPQPYVMSLSSTGHTFAKDWWNKIQRRRDKRLPPDKKPPIWGSIYHIITKPKSNNRGEWYMFEIDDAEFATVDQLDLGHELHQAFASGAKKAADPEDLGGSAGASGENSDGTM